MAEKDTPPDTKEPATETDAQPAANTGAALTTVGTAPAWKYLDLQGIDGRGPVKVRGQWLDDEPGTVEIEAKLDGAHLTLAFEPDRARAFAEQIVEAARFAEEGGGR
ncbi:hypothetical protein [Haloplanus rubicundus]|uniref:Uncharacterized protein n=1 Tax=Haloplanus rubicundus TaxID=1547898 RepID=A0A345EHI5_9EURY|nr:hypothetical protein [Haloplanus rubicundus]AXG11657.1 hypothetical protein DU484_18345 [Haloplanus rubicundus]